MSPQTIFSLGDVAYALGVTKAAVCNYRTRHASTVPLPTHSTPDGRDFWDAAGLREWVEWDVKRRLAPTAMADQSLTVTELERRRTIDAVLGRETV